MSTISRDQPFFCPHCCFSKGRLRALVTLLDSYYKKPEDGKSLELAKGPICPDCEQEWRGDGAIALEELLEARLNIDACADAYKNRERLRADIERVRDRRRLREKRERKK